MFQKKQTNQSSVRSRRPNASVNEAFRRNNVVVSRSQREMAAHQQSVTQRQQDRKKHEASLRLRNQLVALMVLLLLIFCFSRMRLTDVRLVSNASSKLQQQAAETYKQALLNDYQQHTILAQAWLLDGDAFKDQFMKQYPEVESVEFAHTAPFSSNLNVTLRFRKPVFSWTDSSKALQFVDKNGVLFAKNLDPSINAAKLIKIEDQSGIVSDAGSSVLSSQLIQFIGQLYAQLPKLYGEKASVASAVVPRSPREVQMQIAGQPYFIKFNTNRNLEEQIGELGSLLTYLKSQNQTPTSYVDLRIAHKAFFK